MSIGIKEASFTSFSSNSSSSIFLLHPSPLVISFLFLSPLFSTPYSMSSFSSSPLQSPPSFPLLSHCLVPLTHLLFLHHFFIYTLPASLHSLFLISFYSVLPPHFLISALYSSSFVSSLPTSLPPLLLLPSFPASSLSYLTPLLQPLPFPSLSSPHLSLPPFCCLFSSFSFQLLLLPSLPPLSPYLFPILVVSSYCSIFSSILSFSSPSTISYCSLHLLFLPLFLFHFFLLHFLSFIS